MSENLADKSNTHNKLEEMSDNNNSSVKFIETPTHQNTPNIAYSQWSNIDNDDDEDSDPSELSKLPQYTFEDVPPTPNLKSILKNPKDKKKKNKISFEKGNISKQELEQLRIKEIILKGQLDTFKSVFGSKVLNANTADEKLALLKKHRKDVENRQKEIHSWSTRRENVLTTGWSFTQEDPDERTRTAEQKNRLPKPEGKIHRQKVKYQTRIRALTMQYQDLTNQEVRLEEEIKIQKNKVKQQSIPSFVRKLVLKSSSSYTKKIKQLAEVKSQKEDCATSLYQQKFEQKNHKSKFPTYYQ